MASRPLAGIRVLVTRPVHQASVLCNMVAEQGGEAIRFPVIEIEPIPFSDEKPGETAERTKSLKKVDFAIFISPNAVEYGLAYLLAHGGIPDKLKLVTIGQASAEKMQSLIGRAPDIYPTEQYNSEALLALSGLQEDVIKNKHVIIFRGRGGRELLAMTLRQRGAVVEYAEVYQRRKPEPDKQLLSRLQGQEAPDIVTVTSNEGLNNLVAMFSEQRGKNGLEHLWQTPLVVVTDKMRLNAQKMGFNNAIIVAAKPGNKAILASIMGFYRSQ